MGKGLILDIGSNTREFMAGTKDVERGLESVSDTLDDLVRDSTRGSERAADALADSFRDASRDAADELEQVTDGLDTVADDARRKGDDAGDSLAEGIEDGAKEAQKDVEKTADSFKELADSAKRESKRAGSSIGDDVTAGTDRAKEGVGEFKDEAQSTAKEAAASFDGSAESIGDAFQEVAANAFVGFGPAGVAAGLAIAGGLGIAFAQGEKNKAQTEKLKELQAQLAAEFIETGRAGESSLEYVVDRLKELATTTEEGETSLAALSDIADEAGTNYERLAQAYAGNTEGLDDLVASAERRLEQLREERTAQGDVTGGINRAQTALERQIEAQMEVVDITKQAQEAARGAARDQEAYAASGAEILEQQISDEARRTEAIEQANEERKQSNADALAEQQAAADSYSSSVQAAYAAAGESSDTYVENGIYNLEKYTEETRKQADAVTAYQQNMVTLSGILTSDALAYVQGLGPAAAPLIAAFVAAPLDQQQKTAEVWATLGGTSADSFGDRLQNDLNGSSFNANVNLKANPQQIQDALSARRYDIAVNARVANYPNLSPRGGNPNRNGMGVP